MCLVVLTPAGPRGKSGKPPAWESANLGISFAWAKLASFVCMRMCIGTEAARVGRGAAAPFFPDSPAAAGNAARGCIPLERLLLRHGAVTLWG